jgi:ABC-type multidrug transport system ATPase subunit
LYEVQVIIDNYALTLENPNPQEFPLTGLSKCLEPDCATLGIGVTDKNTEWTDYAINYISKSSGLEIGKDIKVLYEIDPMEFINYIKTHPGQTQTGVIICSESMNLPANPIVNQVHCDQTQGQVYMILYNFTIISKNLFDPNLPDTVQREVLAVKLLMDNAILNYHATKNGLKEIIIEVILQTFPACINRFIKDLDVVSINGPLYFFIPPMFVFGLLVSEIVKEKELKLRNGLSVIGVSSTAFWLSWFIVALGFSLLTSNSLIVSAYIFDFDLFTRTPYPILFSVFLLYTMTMMMLGFMISTIITSVKLAYTISYSFLLGGLVLQCFFQSQTLMKLFHVVNVPYWVPWIRYAFTFYPPFNFTKIFNDIASKAGTVPNNADKIWVKGPGYAWKDFFLTQQGYFKAYYFNIPSSYSTFIDLLMNFIGFVILTWYLDNVISSNRGKGSPLWFIFTRQYWGCKKKLLRPAEIEIRNITSSNFDKSEVYESHEGLKLDGIWKKFPGSKNLAVKPLYLNIERDELVAIIGHNGAGKTTLLSMLTGLLNPSGGSAYISGYDVVYDMEKIHKIIGYCPQFNILWEELTGREHLELFAKLRNTPKELRKDLIDSKLDQINLTKSADNLTSTYSGGMKRRLSVAISSIGNPSIIFMDEPTTGMDPITRREVWKLIQTLKKDRVIILTTHAMEEAEVLSDRVIVMAEGQIKCSGTCLYLKNHYGDGYRIEIVADSPNKVWEYLHFKIPSINLIDIAGDSLYISIPRTEIKDVQKFFEVVEDVNIEDWGLRNSSLEEVFMKVTGLLKDLKD